MRVIVAVDEPHGSDLADGLESEGVVALAVVAASALAAAVDGDSPGSDDDGRVRGSVDLGGTLADADAVVLEVSRATVNAVLAEERRRGTIEVKRGATLVLDREALSRRAGVR